MSCCEPAALRSIHSQSAVPASRRRAPRRHRRRRRPRRVVWLLAPPDAERSAGRLGERVHPLHVPRAWPRDHERAAFERARMQQPRDRDEVALAADQERLSVRCRDPQREQRLIDDLASLVGPAEEPLEQRAERDQLRALGDQRDRPDPDLRARHHGERQHAEAVEEHAVPAVEVRDRPSALAVDEPGVGPRDAAGRVPQPLPAGSHNRSQQSLDAPMADSTCLRLPPHIREDVLERVASFSELEKTALRVVALASSLSISQAAARLGMAPVSLTRWLRRRRWLQAILSGLDAPLHQQTNEPPPKEA
jgi:hypothetical protein